MERAVLLIEPDHATRQLYARELGRTWPVLQATAVAGGRRLFAHAAPLAVVLEPYAGAMAGAHNAETRDALAEAWAFVQEGTVAWTGAVPFIICSVIDERATAYALGAALYLLKPLSPHQLVVELQRLLDAAAAPTDKEQIG